MKRSCGWILKWRISKHIGFKHHYWWHEVMSVFVVVMRKILKPVLLQIFSHTTHKNKSKYRSNTYHHILFIYECTYKYIKYNLTLCSPWCIIETHKCHKLYKITKIKFKIIELAKRSYFEKKKPFCCIFFQGLTWL